jgi:hypothetical protein
MAMRQVGSSARARSRIFLDPATSTQWSVIEIVEASYDRRGGRSLVFSSDGVMRRVRDYPPNWAELSDEELIRLSTRH